MSEQTQTLTLTEFLEARLAEDEAAAQAVPYWADFIAALAGGPAARFGVRHDPARVLREVEAKRAILAEHEALGDTCGSCSDGYHSWADFEQHEEPFPCLTLRALASVYSDHPDYREEWSA